MDRDPSHCLGIFIVGHLGVVGNMLSDSSMAVSVVLDTLTLDDKRPGRDGVTRCLQSCFSVLHSFDVQCLYAEFDEVKFQSPIAQNQFHPLPNTHCFN